MYFLFELGKFFPENWGIRLPFYGQISNTTSTPEFDPYDLDVPLKEQIANADTQFEKDKERLNLRRMAVGDPNPWELSCGELEKKICNKTYVKPCRAGNLMLKKQP